MEVMDYSSSPPGPFKPTVIIHGGAGNITRQNLPPESWEQYRSSLISILHSTNAFLATTNKASGAPTALDAAIHAVQLLETNPLFNAGIGAVFTRSGTIELEASVMVSRGSRKRGVGVSLLKHVRSPITLAGEMLRRGEHDDGGGAQGHVQLSGGSAEELAEKWGLEMCEERCFWTRKRWDEHRRGLEREKEGKNEWDSCDQKTALEKDDGGLGGEICWTDDDPGWDGHEYLPQGTVGCVVMDSFGILSVATSTGGISNKLAGRLGDTPTLGAGFWAEEWVERMEMSKLEQATKLGQRIASNFANMLPMDTWTQCLFLPTDDETADCEPNDQVRPPALPPRYGRRAVAMSGTGNGDSFLRLCAARTTAALVRFSTSPPMSLAQAVRWMAGPSGELQRSAGANWGRTGEGEGGIIGIEVVGSTGHVVADFNRAMFRTWVDENGVERCMVFRDEY